MAGDETARLAHALDAHVYNFFKVLVFQQLSLSVPLFHYFMSCVMLLFHFHYLSTHFAEIGSETTSKNKNIPGGGMPPDPPSK